MKQTIQIRVTDKKTRAVSMLPDKYSYDLKDPASKKAVDEKVLTIITDLRTKNPGSLYQLIVSNDAPNT